jgi:hypothetical protein
MKDLMENVTDEEGLAASPPVGRKARDAFRPQDVSVSSHLRFNSVNPKLISSAHCAMAAELIVSVNHSIEVLNVGWLRLVLAQPKPCGIKANLFLEARSHAVNVRLLRWRNVSVQNV